MSRGGRYLRVDGQRILIERTGLDRALTKPQTWRPKKAEQPAEEPADGRININTATVEELTQLEGVGQASAERIIVHRPFEFIDDLERVGGIGQAIIDRNRELLTV